MEKTEDKDTRYYIDIDLKSKMVVGWGFGDRFELTKDVTVAGIARIFITKGQYNKLNEENKR